MDGARQKKVVRRPAWPERLRPLLIKWGSLSTGRRVQDSLVFNQSICETRSFKILSLNVSIITIRLIFTKKRTFCCEIISTLFCCICPTPTRDRGDSCSSESKQCVGNMSTPIKENWWSISPIHLIVVRVVIILEMVVVIWLLCTIQDYRCWPEQNRSANQQNKQETINDNKEINDNYQTKVNKQTLGACTLKAKGLTCLCR